jgi:uncharacterized membrane protein YhhN
MVYFFLWIAIFVAIVDWIAVARNWRRIEYIAKPAFMVILLVWLGGYIGFKDHIIWFALGLIFSLAGDVFLMLPKERFIAGLISFLLCHLAYLIGFNSTFPPFNLPVLFLAILVAVTAIQIYRRIAAGLKSGGNEQLRIPVLIYSIVIGLMLLSATITLVRPDWQPTPALIVSGGALLFFLSDTLLAWNKFVTPLPNGRVLVMVTYQLGQLLITLGAALRFLNNYK